MVFIKQFVKLILQCDDLLVLPLLLQLELLNQCIVLFITHILSHRSLLLPFHNLLVFDKLLYLLVNLFLLVFVEINAIQTIFNDPLVPVVVLDDFDDLLLLIGAND